MKKVLSTWRGTKAGLEGRILLPWQGRRLVKRIPLFAGFLAAGGMVLLFLLSCELEEKSGESRLLSIALKDSPMGIHVDFQEKTKKIIITRSYEAANSSETAFLFGISPKASIAVNGVFSSTGEFVLDLSDVTKQFSVELTAEDGVAKEIYSMNINYAGKEREYPLLIPGELTAVLAYAHKVELAWVDTNTRETAYVLTRGGKILQTIAPDAEAFVDRRGLIYQEEGEVLDAGEHVYQVYAVDEEGRQGPAASLKVETSPLDLSSHPENLYPEITVDWENKNINFTHIPAALGEGLRYQLYGTILPAPRALWISMAGREEGLMEFSLYGEGRRYRDTQGLYRDARELEEYSHEEKASLPDPSSLLDRPHQKLGFFFETSRGDQVLQDFRVDVQTLKAPPSPPVFFHVDTRTGPAVLTWQGGASPVPEQSAAGGYLLEWRDKENDWIPMAITPASSVTFTDISYAPGVRYRAAALNNGGISDYVENSEALAGEAEQPFLP